MISVEKFEIKVLLEGVEVKINSVQISERSGTPPTAVITFPGSPNAIFLLPKTVCELYVRIRNRTLNVDKFYLIFEGELSASAMNRMQDKRVVQHSFTGILHNWVTTLMSDLSATMQSATTNVLLMNAGTAYATRAAQEITGTDGAPAGPPIEGKINISSPQTPRRWDPTEKEWRAHNGVDITGGQNAQAIATANGYVYVIDDGKLSYGLHIILKHTDASGSPSKYSTLYGHLASSSFKVGVVTWVTKGTVLGTVGNSGASRGIHLHYEVRIDGKAVEAKNYFSLAGTAVVPDPPEHAKDAAAAVNKVREAFNSYTSGMLNYGNNFPTASTETDKASVYYEVAQTYKDEYKTALDELGVIHTPDHKNDPVYWNMVYDDIAEYKPFLENYEEILKLGSPSSTHFGELTTLLGNITTKRSLESLITINSWTPLQFFAMLLGNKKKKMSIPEALGSMLESTAVRIGGYYRMIDAALKIFNKVHIIDNPAAKEIVEVSSVNEYLAQSLTNMASGSASTTIYTALMTLISKISYKITELAAPVHVDDKHMRKLFIHPHSNYMVPCTSNIIFNDDILNMSFSHSWDNEPTRVVARVLPANLQSSDIMNIAFSTVMPQGDNLADAVRPKHGVIHLTAEEWLRGVHLEEHGDDTNMGKMYLGAFLKENFKTSYIENDVDGTLAKVLKDKDDSNLSDQYIKWLKSNTSKYKQYALELAQIDYIKTRQESRNLSMSTLYNPYRLCGMSCMIIDDIFPGMVGTLSAINTIFSADGSVTQSLGISGVRVVDDGNLTGLSESADLHDVRPTNKMSQFVTTTQLADADGLLEMWLATQFKPDSIYENYYKFFGIAPAMHDYYKLGTKAMYVAIKKAYNDIGYEAIKNMTYRDLCDRGFMETYYNRIPDGAIVAQSERKVPFRIDRRLRVLETMHMENGHITTESL